MELELVGLLVPLGVCVVLPVMIVWLVTRTRQNETNKKTEIMLKAIESGATIDADFFKDTQKKAEKHKGAPSESSYLGLCDIYSRSWIGCSWHCPVG